MRLNITDGSSTLDAVVLQCREQQNWSSLNRGYKTLRDRSDVRTVKCSMCVCFLLIYFSCVRKASLKKLEKKLGRFFHFVKSATAPAVVWDWAPRHHSVTSHHSTSLKRLKCEWWCCSGRGAGRPLCPGNDRRPVALIQAVGVCELHAFFSYRWMTKRYGARRD